MTTNRLTALLLTLTAGALVVPASASALDVAGVWSTGLTDVRVTETSPGTFTGVAVFGINAQQAKLTGCHLVAGQQVWKISGTGPSYSGTTETFAPDGSGSCPMGSAKAAFLVFPGGAGSPADNITPNSSPGSFLRLCRGADDASLPDASDGYLNASLGLYDPGFPGTAACSDELREATRADLTKHYTASDYIGKVHRSKCTAKGKLTYFVHFKSVPADPLISAGGLVNGHGTERHAEDGSDEQVPQVGDWNYIDDTRGSVTFTLGLFTKSKKKLTKTFHFSCGHA